MTTFRTANNAYVVQTFGFGVETAGNVNFTIHYQGGISVTADYSPLVDHMRFTPLDVMLPMFGAQEEEAEPPPPEEYPAHRNVLVRPKVPVQQASRI
jgi:hypothetical protein